LSRKGTGDIPYSRGQITEQQRAREEIEPDEDAEWRAVVLAFEGWAGRSLNFAGNDGRPISEFLRTASPEVEIRGCLESRAVVVGSLVRWCVSEGKDWRGAQAAVNYVKACYASCEVNGRWPWDREEARTGREPVVSDAELAEIIRKNEERANARR
jgi:hypothetical protein